MRLRSLLSEAWRNLAGGTSRAALMVVILAVASGALAAADAQAQVSALADAHDYRASGAAIYTLQALHAVDGEQCERLSTVDGVMASGALRRSDQVTLSALPSTPVSTFDVSHGLLDVLTGPGASRSGGVWLSDALASALGADVGDRIVTNEGESRVAGVFDYPNDGRSPLLSYALLSPSPITTAFDQCWAEIWPTSDAAANLLWLAHSDHSGDDDAQRAQLNSKLGASFDLVGALANRSTAPLRWAALAVGLLVGAVSIRVRRLEYASARHAGITVPTQLGQTAVETVPWAAASVVLAAPLVLAASWWHNPGLPWSVFVDTLWMPVGAAGCAVFGALLVALTTRERQLFRYFKER